MLFPEDLHSYKDKGDAQVQAHPLSLQGGKGLFPIPHTNIHPHLTHLQGETQVADKLQGENLLLFLSSHNFYT